MTILDTAAEVIAAYYAQPGPGRYIPGDTVFRDHPDLGRFLYVRNEPGAREGFWRCVSQWRGG